MTPERYQRINAIVDGALELPAPDRIDFVDRECGGDLDLRASVLRLLEAEQVEESFLDTPAFEAAAREIAAERVDSIVGNTLGPYRIDSLLGVGGMGEVFLAQDTRLNRRVALKLLPESSSLDETARRRFLREARAASALSDSGIVTIHAIDRVGGRDAIVMEYVRGETLRQRIDRGPLSVEEVSTVGVQVASAIAAAHESGLVHRDLKPSNILLAESGHAKVVDFGLAKRFGGAGGDEDPFASLTDAGLLFGTAAYMSPEQSRGEELDGRSDVFSLGSVLFEAATGRRPFEAPTVLATLYAINNVQHVDPTSLRPDLPKWFDFIMMRALAKDRSERFATAIEFRDALALLVKTAAVSEPATPRRLRVPMSAVAAVVVVLASVGGWFLWRQYSLGVARDAIVQAEKLVGMERYFEAYQLLEQAKSRLPEDPTIERLRPVVTDTLTVSTTPAGARVYLRRFDPDDPEQEPPRSLAGLTPIDAMPIGRADYILEIELEGYEPIRRSVSSALGRVQRAALGSADVRRTVSTVETDSALPRLFLDADAPILIDAVLAMAGSVPPDEVSVPGGEYRIVGHGRPSMAAVQLQPYMIDTCEVSNAQYREFVRAGGYVRREYWRHPFKSGDTTLTWAEAMTRFRDRTGLPGPRDWSNQTFPEAEADHPVTGVSWYEAAAYAEFRGRRLPTVFQWEKAARDGEFTHADGFIMPWGLYRGASVRDRRANFLGSGVAPVNSHLFGMSRYGCLNMAGNVAEWCLNPSGAGFVTAGGSWKDQFYLFSSYGTFPGLFESNALGFRCVSVTDSAGGDEGAMPLDPAADVPRYVAPSNAEHAAMMRHYTYDRVPLEPRIVEEVESADWRREKIEFVGALGRTAHAYLYLPRNVAFPVQAIHYIPTDAAYYGFTVPEEIEVAVAPYIKSGRAVFTVVLEGYRERPFAPGSSMPPIESSAFRELVVRWSIDHARGLDYLLSRPDIDGSRLACLAMSVNTRKVTLVAVESRYRSVVLIGGGLLTQWRGMIPECNGANFASFITAPKLMINGRFDEAMHLTTEAEPLFALMREPKELVIVEEGHIPPLEMTVPIVNRWLDNTIGPVKSQ